MSVTKVATGIQVSFDIVNQGPGDFTSVSATLAYDEAVVSYVSDNPSTGAYVDGAGGGTWTVGTVSGDSTETFEVILSVDDLSSLPTDVTLTVSATEDESSDADNTITKTITEAVVLGGLTTGSRAVRTITGTTNSFLVGVDNVIIMDGSGGDVTIDLPDPATAVDSNGDAIEIVVKAFDDNAAGSALTIDSGAGNLIYDATQTGAQTLVLVEGEARTLVSDGTSYHTVSGL